MDNGHTPTPWALHEDGDWIYAPNAPDAGDIICCAPDAETSDLHWHRANAAFIVRAVNAHKDLIAALEKARDQFLFYERSHLAKYSERDLELVRKGIVDVPLGRDAYDKAIVNREMAEMCAAALVKAKGEANG